jgi:hypothetical protein
MTGSTLRDHAAHSTRADAPGSSRRDVFTLAAVAAALLVWFLVPFVVHAYAYPVGPDGPVYLWWTRLGGVEGLSSVERPGTIALIASLGVTGVGLAGVVAGLECALGVGVGLAGAAIARAGGASRAGWALTGVLVGVFATHLVAGYVSNLAQAATFLAAIVALTRRSRRSLVAAAVLLGVGALAHPLFFFVGAGALLGAVALGVRDDRTTSARAAIALAGGAMILSGGELLLAIGPAVLQVDTSQDAFFRRAGLIDTLRSAYVSRFVARWPRYVEWASIPFAIAGLRTPRGWIRRVLWSWSALTVLGVGVGLITRWYPPDRVVTFGFAIPILAAAGIVRDGLPGRRVPRWRPVLAAAALVAMLVGPAIVWLRAKPYLSSGAVRDVGVASAFASRTPIGAPWIFVVDSGEERISFLATQLQNVIRAAVRPDRIRDVYVAVPAPAPRASPSERSEWSALAALYAHDAAGAVRRSIADGHGPGVVIRIARFERGAPNPSVVCEPPACATTESATTRVADGVRVSAPVAGRSPAEAADGSPDASFVRGILAAPAMLVVLAAIGFAWARLSLGERWSALALSPAFGAAAVAGTGFLADRAGLRLGGFGAQALVLAIAAGGGVLALAGERRRRAHSPA